MKKYLIALIGILVLSLGFPASVEATSVVSVEATITADNRYALYYGNGDGTSLTFVGRDDLGNHWSTAEIWNFSMAEGDYIYVAAWSDDAVAQGLLGQFITDLPSTILTNPTDWEVYLTFDNRGNWSPAPTVAEMSSQIAGATWSPVSYYIDHGGSPWGTVSGIDSAAKWIWGSPLTPGSGHGEYQIFRTRVGISTYTVSIDIKPGSDPNSINPNSKGVIPVAILTTPDFDATTVDPQTVRFGPTGTKAAPVHYALEDVDSDGDIDMILHFRTQDTGIAQGDTSATLTGETYGGTPIAGTDSVRTVDK